MAPSLRVLIWYGNFTSTQRSIIVDFISSLSSTTPGRRPSVCVWWATTLKLYHAKADPASSGRPLSLSLNSQVLDEHCSLGKSLRIKNIARFAAIRSVPNSITVFLTAAPLSATGASYNAEGVNSRKCLLPALFDPSTSQCSTLV